ncbi:DUF1129 family protein, partial [Streptococcus iniae]
PSWIKIIAALTLVMLSWIGLYTGAALLPQALNPQLPAFALVVLGAIAFGSRYLLQRKYNIQSAMSAQQHS